MTGKEFATWNDKRVRDRMQRMIRNAPDEWSRALLQEANIEMTEAKRRCPVLTGVLRSTGHVDRPVIGRGEITVDLMFGGPAAPYAAAVHEDTWATHKNGQDHYLSSVINESQSTWMSRLARRVDLNRMAG